MRTRIKKLKRVKQMMGLPPESLPLGTSPSTSTCLSLLGPTLVRGGVNKDCTIKIWPLKSACQAIGMIYSSVICDEGIRAVLLRYTCYANTQTTSTQTTSNKDSQFTSTQNLVAFVEFEAPERWGWSEVKQRTAHNEFKWELALAGYQNPKGLPEQRVAAVK